jgi:hypothetical protein
MYSNYAQTPTGGGLAVGATLTSGVQAAALVSTPGPMPPAAQGRVIRGYINITGGATPGAYAIKCFQGNGLAGTQIGPAGGDTFLSVVGASQVSFSFLDTTAAGAPNGVYTIGVTAAGSNGTYNDGAIEVFVPVEGSDI